MSISPFWFSNFYVTRIIVQLIGNYYFTIWDVSQFIVCFRCNKRSLIFIKNIARKLSRSAEWANDSEKFARWNSNDLESLTIPRIWYSTALKPHFMKARQWTKRIIERSGISRLRGTATLRGRSWTIFFRTWPRIKILARTKPLVPRTFISFAI